MTSPPPSSPVPSGPWFAERETTDTICPACVLQNPRFQLCGVHMPTEMTASFLPADNDEIIEARAVLAARQRVRDSFHCRSASGKCRCVYCTRDVEGLVEHAADYELRHFSEQKKREEVESKLSALESECEHLRAENARLRKLLEPPYADSAMPRSRKAREWRARALKAEAAHAEAERRETRTEKDQG